MPTTKSSDKNGMVLIEAAHFYAGERLRPAYPGTNYLCSDAQADLRSQELIVGAELGARIAQIINRAGLNVSCCTLVDDVALKSEWRGKSSIGLVESRSTGATLQQIKEVGFKTIVMYRETDLLDKAVATVAELQEAAINNSAWKLNGNGRKVRCLATGQVIKLLGKDGNSELPSCEVLDLCIYREKMRNFNIALTVLPDKYLAQQERVRCLFELLGETPAVVTLRHDKGGKLIGFKSWNPNQTRELDNILMDLIQPAG